MKKASLLVVDDEAINLVVMSSVLEDDYLLFMAQSGEEALRLAHEHAIDLVLLDVMMPEMNGYQTLEKLRSMPETQHLPVIFVTALKDTASEREGIGLGAVDFISKPFDAGVLKLRVANQVELARYRHNLEEQVALRSREVSALRDAAERESRAKTIFIRSLHDCLKNPLSAISGFSQLLQPDASHDEVKEYGARIFEGAELISSLLNTMLRYTELENEVIRNQRDEISVNEIWAEVIDLLAFVARDRGVTVLMPNADDLMAYASHDYLRTALVEVVKNAILFSPQGGVVTLVASRQPDGVLLVVMDQGSGVAAGDVVSAMMPFNRLGKPLGKDGLGLGLAVVHRILDALAIPHGMDNRPEGGLRFWLKLPLI